jgi:hypothetical protein
MGISNSVVTPDYSTVSRYRIEPAMGDRIRRPIGCHTSAQMTCFFGCKRGGKLFFP